MSMPLIFGAVWVICATIVAMLPMRRQYAPGLTLLILAPVLLVWIGYQHGWLITLLAVIGFVSMFRNPLRYIARRLRGENPEIPK